MTSDQYNCLVDRLKRIEKNITEQPCRPGPYQIEGYFVTAFDHCIIRDSIRQIVHEELEKILNPTLAIQLPILMTISEFADLVCKDGSTVSRWIKEGLIKLNRAGLITAGEARKFIT